MSDLKKFRQAVQDVLELAEAEDSPYYADVRFSDLAITYQKIEAALQPEIESLQQENEKLREKLKNSHLVRGPI